MTFRFSLTGPSPAAAERARAHPLDPLEAPDDYTYLAMRACAALEATDAAFHIGGFGTDDWAFDIGYDMSAFMEELPCLIASLRAREECAVDLYPQGVERTLTFSAPAGSSGQVRISCTSRTSWVPRPAVEIAHRAELLAMSLRLTQAFATALRATAPPLARLAPFSRWPSADL